MLHLIQSDEDIIAEVTINSVLGSCIHHSIRACISNARVVLKSNVRELTGLVVEWLKHQLWRNDFKSCSELRVSVAPVEPAGHFAEGIKNSQISYWPHHSIFLLATETGEPQLLQPYGHYLQEDFDLAFGRKIKFLQAPI